MAASARAASVNLVIEDQRVEGDVALHAAPVQRGHGLRQFVQREAHLGARGEVLQSEIDRVRAGLDGRAELRPVSGRTHDFRLGSNPHDLISGYQRVDAGLHRWAQ